MTVLVESSTQALPRRRIPLSTQMGHVLAVTFVADALVITGSLLLAYQFRSILWGIFEPVTFRSAFESTLTQFVLVIWLLCLVLRGGYRRHNIGAGFDEFRNVATASATTFLVAGTLAFLTHTTLSRGYLVLAFLIGTPLLLGERYVLRKAVHSARRHGYLRSRAIAVSSPLALSELDTTLSRTKNLGLGIVGTCLPNLEAERDLSLPVPCYGGVNDVLHACLETEADTVIVSGSGNTGSRTLRRIGWALEGRNIDLVVVPSLIDIAGPRIHMRHLSGVPLVHVEEPQVAGAGGFAKRAFDLIVASLMILVLSPVMIAIALAVKLQDGGPVFFRQERSGRHGERFWMTKFRSMVVDADSRIAELVDFNDVDDVLFKMRHDPRITRAGKFIRRYSLDELPQLFDVLRGDMSLVGPRPPLPREVEQYPPDMHRRLLVRPGLTGLWQVSGRSDLSFDEAIRMDLYYVDNWSIVGDIIIMLKTVRAVFLGEGAY